ncbi:MAG: VCBS repeat-containing protein [Acidimicrobiaceae bacterium]|nr:VCBS repeat-containing protein [Acidimicrobiaceae bacterium]
MGVGTLALRSLPSMAQEAMSSRGIKAAPRKPRSGKPFLASFMDVGPQAGLVHPVICGDVDRKRVILETIGCGVAFIDYDNDGWQDIFILSGTRLDGETPGPTNRLYKNNRDGTFTDVTQQAGLMRTGWACSVTVGDYNNDGYEDIFITYYGQNVLYRNNGDGTFTDVTVSAGLSTPGKILWGAGCTFVDYDRDGHLDLFVYHYVNLNINDALPPGGALNCKFRGVSVHCGPRGLPL